MNERPTIQFRLKGALWFTAVVALVLDWAVTSFQQKKESQILSQLLHQEAPWIKGDDGQLDWRKSSLRPDEFRLTVSRVVAVWEAVQRSGTYRSRHRWTEF